MAKRTRYVGVLPDYHRRLRRLKLSPEAFMVALCLRHFDGHIMTGLHLLQAPLPLLLMSDFDLSRAQATKVIKELEAKGWLMCRGRILWVIDQAAMLGVLKPSDSKVAHIQGHLCELLRAHENETGEASSEVIRAFVSEYGPALGVEDPGELPETDQSSSPSSSPEPVAENMTLELCEPDRQDQISEQQWTAIEEAIFDARSKGVELGAPKPVRRKLTQRQRGFAEKLMVEKCGRAGRAEAEELRVVILRQGEALRRAGDRERFAKYCRLSALGTGTFYEEYRDRSDLDERGARAPPGRRREAFKGNEQDAFAAAGGGKGWRG